MVRLFISIILFSINPSMLFAQTCIRLDIGTKSMTATIVDNSATQKLISILADGPLTIELDDYGGFEKVGQLPQSLPTSDTQITTVPGDIMLYQGRNLVIFYGSNSWSYTPLGKIDDSTASNLREFLGSGSVSLTISLITASDNDIILPADISTEQKVFDLNGIPVKQFPLNPGVYIVNGKKTIVR